MYSIMKLCKIRETRRKWVLVFNATIKVENTMLNVETFVSRARGERVSKRQQKVIINGEM